MKYDSKVPQMLKKEQQWFGSIISRTFDSNNWMLPVSPSGKPMEKEAAEHIVPSPTLSPQERMQIYNQQFWWRLLKTLHETFPLATRLLGYKKFNQLIGVPYLAQFPPRHWSLNVLGDRLVAWTETQYRANNIALIADAVRIDWAFISSICAAELKSISSEQFSTEQEMAALMTKTLYMQPHMHVFEMDYDLFKFRTEVIKQDPDYWQSHPLPELKRGQRTYFALYRNPRQDISWKEITKGEYRLLSLFMKGISIEKACEWLEKQDNALLESAMANLQSWFQDWTKRGWLVLENPEAVSKQHFSRT